jgi:hypothetical protein
MSLTLKEEVGHSIKMDNLPSGFTIVAALRLSLTLGSVSRTVALFTSFQSLSLTNAKKRDVNKTENENIIERIIGAITRIRKAYKAREENHIKIWYSRYMLHRRSSWAGKKNMG